jgi:leucyl aminopeptidase
MTMIKLSRKNPEKYTGDMIAFCVWESEKNMPKCQNEAVQKIIDRASSVGDFIGKDGQMLLNYPEPVGQLHAKRVLVIGLGEKKETRETFRKAGGTIAGTALKTKAREVFLVMPETEELGIDEVAECLSEGLMLGAYQFNKYKAVKKNGEEPGRLDRVFLSCPREEKARQGVKKGNAAAAASCVARDMANEPANKWTPTSFASYGKSLSKNYGFTCRVLNENDMKRLKMGGILGVSSGSAEPPKMVIVEYINSKKAPTLLLVGKGLTFDSGGINIKPSTGLEEMKYDMCGGAAVLAAMQAIGEEKPTGLNVVAVVPASENMPGPSAQRPGDIITIYGGKTVEVINTDAEGRLILADALAYGIKQYKPSAVIDLATLTGAVIVGLGHHRTGLLSNDDDLVAKIEAAGERSGEPLWRLPLGTDYTKQLESPIADLKNIGNRTGGTITAGAFLQEFVGETPWAHLDIAGTAWNFTEKPYIPKGPSGTGVRTLLELVRNWK